MLKNPFGKKKLVYIVDDDKDICLMLRTILETTGAFAVEEFYNGKSAIVGIQKKVPDVLLLDIMMPEMSGYDVVVRLKQKPSTQNIPIILISAKGDPEDIMRGYSEFGVEYYITKPFTSKQVIAGVKLVLGDENALG